MFTQEQIDERRKAAHEAGVSGVLAIRAELQLPTEGLQPPTLAQCSQLLSFRLNQVHQICAAFKPAALPKKVFSAAVTFMQRFYLRRSCMLHDPQLITVACIYIAAKASERYVDAARLESMLSVKAKDILACETEVLDALEFDLVVYHPYRNIDALVEEIKTAAKSGGEPELEALAAGEHWLANVHKLAYSFADALMKSDAPLRMTPAQQAMGALAHALAKYGFPPDRVVARYGRMAREAAGGGGGPEAARAAEDVQSHIQDVMQQADELAAAGFKTCNKETASALDKALRTLNPALDRNSKAAKQLRSIGKKRKRVADDDDDD